MNQVQETPRDREKRLIELVKGGNEQAYIELIEPLRPKLFRKACSILRNSEDAEDALQDSLVTAYFALPKFRAECSLYTWLYRIVVNKCRDHIRSSKNRSTETIDPQGPGVKDDRISVEKNVELSERADYLIGVISKLDKKYRKILLMRYYDDLSYREISEILNINEGTVKSRLFKARELMKRMLVPGGKDGSYSEEE